MTRCSLAADAASEDDDSRLFVVGVVVLKSGTLLKEVTGALRISAIQGTRKEDKTLADGSGTVTPGGQNDKANEALLVEVSSAAGGTSAPGEGVADGEGVAEGEGTDAVFTVALSKTDEGQL
jgi:hypothetical protein